MIEKSNCYRLPNTFEWIEQYQPPYIRSDSYLGGYEKLEGLKYFK